MAETQKMTKGKLERHEDEKESRCDLKNGLISN